MLKLSGMVKCVFLMLRGPVVSFRKKRLQQLSKDKNFGNAAGPIGVVSEMMEDIWWFWCKVDD